ncbi:NAD-dependent epimerase/dehydratase family protein [Roseibium sp. RKSG952]|uniref:NAD-dependent epimerase/dehydratase family protein n=1 Tax=Roseibium sp. RKSG952 TaxID=2529384 RepID=UPI0018AD1E84
MTGGTGTIGRSVIRRLIADGCSVIGLARSEASAEKLRRAGASAYPGDLTAPQGWAERAASCDAVIHTGATFDADMAAVDRQAIAALLKAAIPRQKRLRLVYTGGIWLFPDSTPDAPLTQTSSFDPLPAFKWSAEQVRSLLSAPSLNLSVIHPALVCATNSGPLHNMARTAARGEPFQTRATPDTRWPLVHADDLAGLYASMLKHRAFRAAVIAAAIPGAPVGTIAKAVSKATGQDVTVETVGAPETCDPKFDWAAGYAKSQSVRTETAKRMTNWAPDFESLETLTGSLFAPA